MSINKNIFLRNQPFGYLKTQRSPLYWYHSHLLATGSLVAWLDPKPWPSVLWGSNWQPSHSIEIPEPTEPLSPILSHFVHCLHWALLIITSSVLFCLIRWCETKSKKLGKLQRFAPSPVYCYSENKKRADQYEEFPGFEYSSSTLTHSSHDICEVFQTEQDASWYQWNKWKSMKRYSKWKILLWNASTKL